MMAKVTFTKPAKSFNYKLAKKSLGERNRLKDRVALEEIRSSRNDLLPRMVLENRPVALLRAPHRNVREQQHAHETEVAFSIKKLGFSSPPIVTEDGEIIDGVTKVAAAAALGMTELPCIVIYDLSQQDTKLLRIALNRLGEKGSWDIDALKTEFDELLIVEAPVAVCGFALPEIDALTLVNDGRSEVIDRRANKCPELDERVPPVSRLGDQWLLGRHRLICGDATKQDSYELLFGTGSLATAVFTDPPYNIEIDGFAVGKGKRHREFLAASGEMTDDEFVAFLRDFLEASAGKVIDGGVLFVCMDWRHAEHVLRAARSANLTVVTIVVWSKTNGGMGGLYRSSHEFVFVLKKGTRTIHNNVQLGKHGRDRTNVWVYPGANSRGSSANSELKNHPTPKPVELISDALLDVTARGDIIIDPFLGSGTSIIAAEKTGRIVYGMELDPRYVDLIIHRFETYTKIEAVHAETNVTFKQLKALREKEGVIEMKPTTINLSSSGIPDEDSQRR